jgi:hypothetical protein
MVVRMKDIAEDLGLSVVTISKVLRNHPDISNNTEVLRGRTRFRAIERTSVSAGHRRTVHGGTVCKGKLFARHLILATPRSDDGNVILLFIRTESPYFPNNRIDQGLRRKIALP